MKAITLLATVFQSAQAADPIVVNACLTCKYLDTNAGFLYSYSYCKDEGENACYSDYWNLINSNKNCMSSPVAGYELDIENDCEAEEEIGLCPSYQSDEFTQGVYMNFTKQLDNKQMCKIDIDGTKAIARVIFDDTDTLGVLYPGYVIGEPITVQQGSSKTVTIYNGGNQGPISFVISFSTAGRLALSGVMAATAALSFIY